MRYSGVLAEQDRFAGADHLCWVYDDPASLIDAAQRNLAERIRTLVGLTDLTPVTFSELPR